MKVYDIAASIHRGDAFDVYYTDGGVGMVIQRRTDGAERFLQDEDATKLESELDLFGCAFDDNTEYVEHADRHLSEFFTE